MMPDADKTTPERQAVVQPDLTVTATAMEYDWLTQNEFLALSSFEWVMRPEAARFSR